MTLDNSISFTNNTALTEGGAIKWNIYEPSMSTSKISFLYNSAGVYGNDVASVARELKRYTYDSETESYSLSRMLDSTTTSDIYQSGG